MNWTILGIRPSPSGEEVEVRAEGRDRFSVEREVFSVATELYSELSLPYTLFEPMETDPETVELLNALSLRTDAIKKGISLLSFSENTAKGLWQKLVMRGCSKEAASEAVAFLLERGFIPELSQAKRLIEDLAQKKCYGESRIRRDLYAKGFPESVIDEALSSVEIDFISLCRKRIVSLGGISAFSDQKTRIKAFSSLSRYGFSYDQIQTALRKLKENE